MNLRSLKLFYNSNNTSLHEHSCTNLYINNLIFDDLNRFKHYFSFMERITSLYWYLLICILLIIVTFICLLSFAKRYIHTVYLNIILCQFFQPHKDYLLNNVARLKDIEELAGIRFMTEYDRATTARLRTFLPLTLWSSPATTPWAQLPCTVTTDHCPAG